MKRIFLYLAAALCCLCLTACQTDTPPETTAPIQSVPTTKTVYLHTSVTQEHGASVTRTEYVYDEADRLTHIVTYANDQETSRYQVQCDENGNAIRWSSGNTAMQCSYDAEGHTLGTSVLMDGRTVSATTYEWTDGLRTAIISTGKDFESRHSFTYDEAGHLVRQDIYTNGELTGYTVCTNDEQGRVVNATAYLPDGSAASQITYVYGDVTETRTTTLADGTVTQIVVLTYDENGNLATSVTRDGAGSVIEKQTHLWRAVTVPIDCPRAPI